MKVNGVYKLLVRKYAVADLSVLCSLYALNYNLLHHLVVIYSGIPTLQDYQTWVPVTHCAWHPLSHLYLSVLATYLYFGSEEISFSRARKIFFSWVMTADYPSDCFFSFVLKCWASSCCNEESLKSKSTLETTSSWIHACCFSVYWVSPVFLSFFFLLQYPLCKWPQPNSQ